LTTTAQLRTSDGVEVRRIRSFPGYFASRDGRIFSNGLRGLRQLSPSRSRRGYLAVNLALGIDRRKPQYIHRPVLIAFVGEAPDGFECDHIDGNPSNNSIDNLRWVTHQENVDAAIARRGEHWSTAMARVRKMRSQVAA
jgi:hypothetical protein